jgi:subtilase family serine protease
MYECFISILKYVYIILYLKNLKILQIYLYNIYNLDNYYHSFKTRLEINLRQDQCLRS